MQARQRSPRGFYASEYRQQRDVGMGRGRRGGGGGGGDIFVEAGRLAAEYLVSQGLLPPNALPPLPKWQNHKTLAEGGRQSALQRLGSVDGRRKLGGFDEFGQKGGRRRGSFNRSNGMDWGREYRRNGSWSDRFRGGAIDVRDGEDDDYESGGFSVRHQDEEDQHQYQYQQQQQNSVDDASVKSNSNLNEFVPRSEDGGDLKDKERDKERVNAEMLEVKQSDVGKDVNDVDMEVGVGNDIESVNVGVKEVKDGGGDDESERLRNVSARMSDQENSSSGGVVADLVSLCKSVKVPTRTRSSVTRKNLMAENNGDGSGSAHDVGDLQAAEEVEPENESVKGSSLGDLLGEKPYDVVHVDVDVAEVEPIIAAEEDVKELDAVCKAEEVQSGACQSGPDKGFMQDNNQESSATLPEFGGCSSLAEERGEKRVAEEDDLREDNKKQREWLPSLLPKTGGGGFFLHSNPIEVKESSGVDEIPHIDKVVTMTSDEGSLMSIDSQFTEGGDRPFLQCSEEKPSLPSSFRTCDLNLIEASEVHENHVDHPVLIYPPAVSETKKAVPIDIDLTMSHASVSGKFNTHATNGKEIEVIDLENDSIQDEKTMENIDRKTETMFPGLDGFSNHAQNAADMHDVQDGYGLMISELLGPDFPNCSSVPGDINSVHNEMGLHTGTGALAEDDSIYMSLGELSFLRPWEQPPSQDYQKHF